MKKVIETLMEIEEKSNNIMDEASKQKRFLEDHLQEEMRLFEEKVLSETKQKIEQYKIQLKEVTNPELERLKAEANNMMEDLQKQYDMNKDYMINQVVEKILGE